MEASSPSLQHIYSKEHFQDYFLPAHHCKVNINLSDLSSHHYKGDVILA